MSLLLLLAALASAPAADPAASIAAALPSPVRITLNSDRRFWPGDRARVQVESADDGYLWVLQVDTDGRLRVLFPLDPTDDNFVRGGRRYELRGRGGREAFVADDPRGQGFIYAAWTRQPFAFADFSVNGHWDYRALSPRAFAEDPEPELNELLQRATSVRWEYDLLSYDVRGRDDRRDVVVAPVLVDRYYGRPISLGGRNWWRNSWCSSYWYGASTCDPYRSFGGTYINVNLGWGSPFGYDPYWDDPWYWNSGWNNGWNNWGYGGWGYGGWGHDRWGYGNGWGNNGWYGGGGWGHGGWYGGGYGPGPGYVRPNGTNYDTKGRGRTWSGVPGGQLQPVTFGEVRGARNRTGTTVFGPLPQGPVRDLDDSRGLGRRPVLVGFPGYGGAHSPRTDSAVHDGRARPVGRRGCRAAGPHRRPGRCLAARQRAHEWPWPRTRLGWRTAHHRRGRPCG